MLSEKIIKKFQWAVEQDHGEKLSFAEASEILNDITEYFDLLAKIYGRMKNDDDSKNNKT